MERTMTTEKNEAAFNRRAFVSLVMILCGLGLPVSGVALHVSDSGPMTLARHAWMSAHNILGLLFVVFSIWHIVLNRRTLLNYIRGLGARAVVGREGVWAVVLVAALLFVFVGHAFLAG